MRNTVAKRLRKEAHKESIGLPEKDYGVVRVSVEKAFVQLKLACTRGMYLKKKREYKAK